MFLRIDILIGGLNVIGCFFILGFMLGVLIFIIELLNLILGGGRVVNREDFEGRLLWLGFLFDVLGFLDFGGGSFVNSEGWDDFWVKIFVVGKGELIFVDLVLNCGGGREVNREFEDCIEVLDLEFFGGGRWLNNEIFCGVLEVVGKFGVIFMCGVIFFCLFLLLLV